jgi:hypothetical protein
MRRYWPLILVGIGFLLVLVGNYYFAAVESGSSDTHPDRQHTSDWISLSGTFLLVVGIIASIIVFFIRRFRPKTSL